MSIGKEIGRKLSVAEMGLDKERIQELVFADKGNPVFLARFIGAVTGLKPYRPTVKNAEGETADKAFGLMGNFKGISADGEEKEGSVLYLPAYVNDMIVATWAANEDVQSIRIAFDVYAKYDKDAATSYVFTVNDLLNDGSEAVSEVEEAVKALPLPNQVATITDKRSN